MVVVGVVVVVADVVALDVMLVVWLDVGVVTRQFWNEPATNASVIRLNVAAAASQSTVSITSVLNAQVKSSAPSPSGPLNSPNAAFKAAAVSKHVLSSAATIAALPLISLHVSVPDSAGHASRILLSASTCAAHDCVPSM